jgi:hypothetical protein
MPIVKKPGKIRSKIGSIAHCIFKQGFLDVARHVSQTLSAALPSNR